VLGTSTLSVSVKQIHFNGFTSHQMAIYDYTLAPRSVKVHSPTALPFTGHTYLKPYIYLRINMHGVAIKALSIFMD